MLRRPLLIAAGFAMLGLAALGVALPVLPTTPFVLVAAACFANSSPRFSVWLERNRVFGPYIINYRRGGGVSLRHKVGAMVFLWGGLGVSIALTRAWWMVVIAAVVGTGVTIHLTCIKTAERPPIEPAVTRSSRTRRLPEVG